MTRYKYDQDTVNLIHELKNEGYSNGVIAKKLGWSSKRKVRYILEERKPNKTKGFLGGLKKILFFWR